MGQQVYESKVITSEGVCGVRIYDISEPGVTAKAFGIDYFDLESGDLIKDSNKIVKISDTYLAVNSKIHEDLPAYLAQFKESLPNEISTGTVGVFVYPHMSRTEKIYNIGNLLRLYFQLFPNDPLDPLFLRNSTLMKYSEILSFLDYYATNNVVTGYEFGSASVIAKSGWVQQLNNTIPEWKPPDTKHKESSSRLSNAVVFEKKPEKQLCKAIMFDGNKCNRQIVSGMECICHSEDQDKDLSIFTEAIDNILVQTQDIIFDFTGFHFPSNYDWNKWPQEIGKEVIWIGCTFRGNVALANRNLVSGLRIERSTFDLDLILDSTIFEDDVILRNFEAMNVSLKDTKFNRGCIIEEYKRVNQHSKHQYIFLVGAMFEEPTKVFIKNIILSALVLSHCDVSQVTLIGLKVSESYITVSHGKWGRRRKFPGLRLGDEWIDFRPQNSSVTDSRITASSIAESYQRLQRSQIRLRNYSVGGAMYVREREFERVQHKSWLNWDIIYKLLSNYGESFWKPMVWFAIVFLFLMPLITLYWMGYPHYEFKYSFSALEFWNWHWGDFGKEILANLESIVYFQSDQLDSKTNCWKKTSIENFWLIFIVLQKILAAILISFTVIGFRRRFKRY